MLTATPPRAEPKGRYTEAQASRLLGVHRHTLARWREEGSVKPLPPILGNPRAYYSGKEIMRAWMTH